LRVRGGGEGVRGGMAWCEGVEVIPPLSALTGFVGLGIQSGVLLGVLERLAKPCIVEWYEVFRVVSRS